MKTSCIFYPWPHPQLTTLSLLLYTTQDQGFFKRGVALLIKKTEQMLICSALIKRKEQVGSKGSNMMAFIGVATD